MRSVLFRFVLLLTSFSGCFLSSCRDASRLSPSRPNILLILADDMGYGDVACYNPESKIPTPNMDLLASEGIRFTNAHSPAALCTPTRYGILTGRYCWRTRLKEGVILGYDETPLIEKSRSTMASLLKDQGYHTGYIGKWHLGLTWQTRDGYQIQDDQNKWSGDAEIMKANEAHIDFSKPVLGGPTELGFDYFYGTLGCSTSDPPYCFIEQDRTVGIPNIQSPEEFLALPGFAPGLMVPGFSLEEVDPVFTEKALDFLEAHNQDSPDQPFFLYLSLSSPHNPFLPPDFAKGKSEEGPRGDLVTVVDWSVGKLLDWIREKGLDENTWVIVTSDNGAMRGANGHKSEGDFRGYKGNIWDGGHRIPLISRWPGHIEAGTHSEEVMSLTDLYASFASWFGLSLEADEGADSYDVLPAFFGQTQQDADSRIRIFHSANGSFAIQQGPWKLIEGTKGSGSGKKNTELENSSPIGQLYQVVEDPYEKNDLWDQQTEKVEELLALLEEIKNGDRTRKD